MGRWRSKAFPAGLACLICMILGHAFAMNPQGANLYNKEGFPASPFRTDNW
jgi:hypothetical protein